MIQCDTPKYQKRFFQKKKKKSAKKDEIDMESDVQLYPCIMVEEFLSDDSDKAFHKSKQNKW